MMHLRILTPTGPVVEAEATEVTAPGGHGRFTLLPRHVDFAAALVPGLLTWDGEVVAVDEGVLVKEGPRVTAAVRDAVAGVPLEELRRTVQDRFLALDERERRARATLAMLEAGLLRRLLELR